MSAGCIGSPCAFGCTPNGANGFICGCPTGYQRIGQVRHRCFAKKEDTWILFLFIFFFSFFLISNDQGHCLSTINPLSQGHFGEDISSAPTFVINPDPYHIPPADDKTISTEGCFSCKVILRLSHGVVGKRQRERKNYFLFRRLTGKEGTEDICERNQWIKNWSHGGTKLWRDGSSDRRRGIITGKSISSRSAFDRPGIEWESSNYNRLSRFISLYINFFFFFVFCSIKMFL